MPERWSHHAQKGLDQALHDVVQGFTAVVLCGPLDLMILKVSSNFDDSVILTRIPALTVCKIKKRPYTAPTDVKREPHVSCLHIELAAERAP